MNEENLEPEVTKISSKGQVVIPATIRKKLGLTAGTQLFVTIDESNNVVLRHLPTSLEWRDLIKDIPVEHVDIDDNGKYDPQKSPHFDEWMREK